MTWVYLVMTLVDSQSQGPWQDRPLLDMARNETEVLVPAEIRVQLPPDYMCRVVGDGTADPDGSKGFFTPLAREVDSIV